MKIQITTFLFCQIVSVTNILHNKYVTMYNEIILCRFPQFVNPIFFAISVIRPNKKIAFLIWEVTTFVKILQQIKKKLCRFLTYITFVPVIVSGYQSFSSQCQLFKVNRIFISRELRTHTKAAHHYDQIWPIILQCYMVTTRYTLTYRTSPCLTR